MSQGEVNSTAPTFWSSMVVTYALGIAAGVTVAVVLQDPSVLVPFLVLPLFGAPLLHGLRHLPRKVLWLLAGAAIVAGVVAVVYGHFVSDNGTAQALGVLGGSAAIAVGLASATVFVIAGLKARM